MTKFVIWITEFWKTFSKGDQFWWVACPTPHEPKQVMGPMTIIHWDRKFFWPNWHGFVVYTDPTGQEHSDDVNAMTSRHEGVFRSEKDARLYLVLDTTHPTTRIIGELKRRKTVIVQGRVEYVFGGSEVAVIIFQDGPTRLRLEALVRRKMVGEAVQNLVNQLTRNTFVCISGVVVVNREDKGENIRINLRTIEGPDKPV